MWSLTSLRTKRMSSFRKFRLLPPKDFFDSIGQRPKSWRLKVMSALVRIADNGSTDRQEGKDHSTAEPQIRRLQGMPAESIRLFCLTGKSLLIFRNRVKPRNQKYFCSRLTQ